MGSSSSLDHVGEPCSNGTGQVLSDGILQWWPISDPARDSFFWLNDNDGDLNFDGRAFLGEQLSSAIKSIMWVKVVFPPAAECLECPNAGAPLRNRSNLHGPMDAFGDLSACRTKHKSCSSKCGYKCVFCGFFFVCGKFITCCVDSSFNCDCCSLQFYKLFLNICSKWFIVGCLQPASWPVGKIVHFLLFFYTISTRLGFFIR